MFGLINFRFKELTGKILSAEVEHRCAAAVFDFFYIPPMQAGKYRIILLFLQTIAQEAKKKERKI